MYRQLIANSILTVRMVTVSYGTQGPRKQTGRRNRGHQHYKPDIGITKRLSLLQEDEKHVNTVGMEDIEDAHDEKVLPPRELYHQLAMEEESRQKTIKFKIMERKYFKKAKEPTLLTWSAREQLKYLNESDPTLWTPEKLAESFPISVEGVKKLLKSNKFWPATEEDILKHDKMVLANWKRLKSDSGPISSAVTQLSKIITNFESLDGNNNLPMPKLDVNKTQKSPERKGPTGEFASLIEDYQRLAQRPSRESPSQGTNDVEDEHYCEELQNLSDINRNPFKQVSFEEFKDSLRKDLQKLSKQNPRLYQQYDEWLSDSSPKAKLSLQDVTHEDASESYDINDFFEGKIQRYKTSPEIDLKWDVHRDTKNPRGREAYLYEAHSGYQRPLGRYDEADRVDIPEELRPSNCIFRKGDCYYDENGEFLYRVPLMPHASDQ